MRQSSRLLGLAVLSAVMAEAILLSGCATSAAPPTSALAEDAPALRAALPVPATINPDPAASSDLTPVVRYGRYTLVELVPEPAQRDLMRQVVEVVIPPNLDTNVGDALRHVLRRSGYRLCDTADSAALYALPLPAAHLHLGPLMLRDALLRRGWIHQIRQRSDGPAQVFCHPDYEGEIGLIMPYEKDFCASCNRLRVSSVGKLHLCLFGDGGVDLRDLLEDDAQQGALEARISDALTHKKQTHFLHQGNTGITQNLSYIGG